jgi:hypothetical protein
MPGKKPERLKQEPQIKRLLQLLNERLSNSELQTLLMDVSRHRALKMTPSRVLSEYRESRFCSPSEIPQVIFNRFDMLAYSLLPGNWHSVDLSPVTPLGTCTSLSNLSQNRMVATIRHSEVVADSTSTLAIWAALMRKECLEEDAKSSATINCCASHRLLRAQHFDNEKFSAHFRVFALVSAGRDTGHFTFELDQLEKHLRFYLELSKMLKILEKAEVHVSDFSGKFNARLIEEMFGRLAGSFQEAEFVQVNDRMEARSYYAPLAFRIRFTDPGGGTWDIVDGGFTNWTQRLLNNRKERFLSSAIGSELLFRVFPQLLKPFE